MLNMTNHQRNKNYNHSEISSHTCQNGCYQKKMQITNVGEDIGEREICIPLVGMPIEATTVENHIAVFQKSENRTMYDSEILLLGIHLKKMKTIIQKYTCTSMLTAALLTIAKIEATYAAINR